MLDVGRAVGAVVLVQVAVQRPVDRALGGLEAGGIEACRGDPAHVLEVSARAGVALSSQVVHRGSGAVGMARWKWLQMAVMGLTRYSAGLLRMQQSLAHLFGFLMMLHPNLTDAELDPFAGVIVLEGILLLLEGQTS